MDDKVFARLRDFVEPAHPAVVRLYDDLLDIYRRIREVAQKDIDSGFHRAARQIGYVVTATIPVTLEIGEAGAVKSLSIGADHLKDTIFEKELMEPLRRLQQVPKASPGTYKLYLVWTDALKLKLRKDWIEPAHVTIPSIFERFRMDVSKVVPPEVHEPAHWFDPGLMLSVQDTVLISVIDEVYPELRLADRVAVTREALRRKVFPDVMEPVHFRKALEPGGQR